MHMKKKYTPAAAAAAAPKPDTDKIALVKAAAWAWHQRSSSSITKQSAESTSASPRRRRRSSSHRPSRYRLESLSKSNSATSPDHLESEKQAPITLLDLYEIERITRELERLMVASERRDKVHGKKVRRRKETRKGCWFGKHATMICGSQETALETEALVSRPRRSTSEILQSRSFVRTNIT